MWSYFRLKVGLSLFLCIICPHTTCEERNPVDIFSMAKLFLMKYAFENDVIFFFFWRTFSTLLFFPTSLSHFFFFWETLHFNKWNKCSITCKVKTGFSKKVLFIYSAYWIIKHSSSLPLPITWCTFQYTRYTPNPIWLKKKSRHTKKVVTSMSKKWKLS